MNELTPMLVKIHLDIRILSKILHYPNETFDPATSDISDRELPEYYQLRDGYKSQEDSWELCAIGVSNKEFNFGEVMDRMDLFKTAKVYKEPDSIEWGLFLQDYDNGEGCGKQNIDLTTNEFLTFSDKIEIYRFGDFIRERWKPLSTIEGNTLFEITNIMVNPFKLISCPNKKPVMYSTFRHCWEIINNYKNQIQALLKQKIVVFDFPAGAIKEHLKAEAEFYASEEGKLYLAKQKAHEKFEETVGRGYPLGPWNCYNPAIANIHHRNHHFSCIEGDIPLIDIGKEYRIPDESSINVKRLNKEYFSTLNNFVESMNTNDSVLQLKSLFKLKEIIGYDPMGFDSMFICFLKGEKYFEDHSLYTVSGNLGKYGKIIYISPNDSEIVYSNCLHNTKCKPFFEGHYTSLYNFLFDRWSDLFKLGPILTHNPWHKILHEPDFFDDDDIECATVLSKIIIVKPTIENGSTVKVYTWLELYQKVEGTSNKKRNKIRAFQKWLKGTSLWNTEIWPAKDSIRIHKIKLKPSVIQKLLKLKTKDHTS